MDNSDTTSLASRTRRMLNALRIWHNLCNHIGVARNHIGVTRRLQPRFGCRHHIELVITCVVSNGKCFVPARLSVAVTYPYSLIVLTGAGNGWRGAGDGWRGAGGRWRGAGDGWRGGGWRVERGGWQVERGG